MKINIQTLAPALMAALLALSSCGTKKDLDTPATLAPAAGTPSASQASFLRKVHDNAVYTKNITSKIEFTLKSGDKDISVSGSLQMRKDDVIRIQLTPLGLIEAGRLEFTKDYVMIVDRINKEYIKADYSQVSFLSRNGIDFHTLQSILWNELFQPGTPHLTDSALKEYTVSANGPSRDILYDKGSLHCKWNADSDTGLISQLNITYTGGSGKETSLSCDYSAFKPLGAKHFPTSITLTLDTSALSKARNASIALRLKSIGTDDSWEPRTTLSGKYKEVSAEELITKLTTLQ